MDIKIFNISNDSLNFINNFLPTQRNKKIINIIKPPNINNNPLPNNYNPPVINVQGLNLNLHDIYSENFRNYNYNNFTNLDQELVNQFIWYIVFRGQVVLDMMHDFTEDRNNYTPSPFDKLVFSSLVFTQNYHEIYYLAHKLFPNYNIPFNANNDFQVLLQAIFPEWDNSTSSNGPNSNNPGNCDWWIYHSFFNITPFDEIMPPGWDIYEASFKINLKCGILRTSVLSQNFIFGNNPYNLPLKYPTQLPGTMTTNPFDVPRLIQQNYINFDKNTPLSNTNPSTLNPLISCDTARGIKFQYTAPYLNSLRTASSGNYITSLANIYDAGPTNSPFTEYFINRQDFNRNECFYNVYFRFQNIQGAKVYIHRFIQLKYNNFTTNNTDLTIGYFSLPIIPILPVIPIPPVTGPNNSSVNYLGNRIINDINSGRYEFIILYAAYKFAGDFGKILYNQFKIIDTNSQNILIYGVADRIGANISALFLPGTVFASFSQADIAGTVDSEFYFKRTFGDVYTPVVYPYFNSLTSGLRFGKSKKSKKFKLIDSDIKYLLKK